MLAIAEWIAPAATIIAAVMTAANLGARVTGWGFVVFTIGSIAWSFIGITTGQQPLVLTNVFLTLVNGIGVWRWLGRQAKFEDGSKRAEARSAASEVPALFSAAGLCGQPLTGADGEKLGEVVDAMMECDGCRIAYVVVAQGQKTGLADILRGVDPHDLMFNRSEIASNYSALKFASLPELEKDNWPASLETGRS